jgi:ribonuclease P protein component
VRWASGDACEPPAVGYAVGRHAGGAVVRNRIRRRLRGAIAPLAAELAPGQYLIGASAAAATLPFDELAGALRQSLEHAGALPRR